MRWYQINGQFYPSVTTVLGIIRHPYLERWRGRLGNEEADRVLAEAGDIGSRVHDACEAINTGREWYAQDAQTEAMVLAYQNWFKATVKRIVLAETPVVCRTYRYAGRLDLLVVLKGDKLPTLIDIKTSNNIYQDVPLQLAAYKYALEQAGFRIKRRLVVHIDKQEPGRLTTIEYQEHDRDFNLFLYALALWRHFQGNWRPRPEEITKLEGVQYVAGISA
ncbi:MAG: PD-(D/E)XK nuclease family protein [Peptococcaceae bacterium]|nr:PD-(D/E)XK nuclease family protein [Peptococcaceae bacterium]